MENLTLVEIDELLDASRKITDPLTIERQIPVRIALEKRKAQLLAEMELKKTKPLKSADAVIAEIKKPKRKQVLKPQHRIGITGDSRLVDTKGIRAVLSSYNPRDVEFIVTGTSRGAEQCAVTAAKQLGLRVIQIHPREDSAKESVLLYVVKPTVMFVFAEEETSIERASRYAKIPYQRFSKKTSVKDIRETMKVFLKELSNEC